MDEDKDVCADCGKDMDTCECNSSTDDEMGDMEDDDMEDDETGDDDDDM